MGHRAASNQIRLTTFAQETSGIRRICWSMGNRASGPSNPRRGTGSQVQTLSTDAGRRRIPLGVFCFQNINFVPRILVFLNWNSYKQNSSKKLRTRILVGTSIVSVYFSTKLIIHNWTAQNHWAKVIQKIMERFLVESRKYSSFALGSLYFVLWLGGIVIPAPLSQPIRIKTKRDFYARTFAPLRQ